MPSAVHEEEEEQGAVDQGRNAKRQRLDASARTRPKPQQPRRASRIFAPFRTIGLVSPTPVPFTAVALGKTTFQITTSVGQCLQTYDLKRGLNLVFITRPQTPGPITSTVAVADRVLAAWAHDGATDGQKSRGIWVFKRGNFLSELQMPMNLDEDVVELLAFGSWIVGCCATRIEVWSAATYEHHASLLPPYAAPGSPGSVLTGGICNIPTFPNKILAGRDDGTVEIWNVSTAKLIYTIQPHTSDCGPVTAMQASPALALFAIAYMNGHLVIHDVELDQQILKLSAGRGDQSPITCISFRTDGLGAGDDGREDGVMATASFNSGDVTLWDLNKGGKRMGVLRSAHSAPTSTETSTRAGGISKAEFLTGQSILVTSGLDNSLRTWIFDEVPYSPVPRILHSRSGHAAPITTLDFLPTESDGADSGGKWLLSASQDQSLWGWSLRRDAQSTELSQGRVQKKAKSSGTLGNDHGGTPNTVNDFKVPKITCMACSLNRDGGVGTLPGVRTLWASAKNLKGKSTATEQNVTGWESVVTGHTGEKFARTWFWGRKRAGRWILDTGDGSAVTSVAISPCGTFALLGSATGGIDMYNLQSGLHRQRFPARLTKAQVKKAASQADSAKNGAKDSKTWAKGHGKHSKEVTGLHVDGLNRTVISCALDGKVKFWDFMTGSLLFEINWSGFVEPQQMVYHRQSDLIALSCDDSRIRVVDTQTRRIVRDLAGCVGKINDLCFSNDGRWVIAASADAVIRVWDLPTGHLIDAVRLQQPCTALAFSSTGEYLAIAQEASVGVDLWSNRTLFTHVPTHHISNDDIADVHGPTASGEGGQNIAIAAAETIESSPEPELDATLASVEQLSRDVTTLSLIPKSRWQTLLHLDLIRARNKPKEPPKAPEKAPFFLPSLQQSLPPNSQPNLLTAGDPAAAASSAPSQTTGPDTSRIARYDPSSTATPFTRLLHAAATSPAAHAALITHLKGLAPPAADVAIRSLDPAPPYTELVAFVHALTALLVARRDYELGQAWMAVFLRCHGEVVQEALRGGEDGSELGDAVRQWREEHRRETERLGGLVGYCAGVVGFLRSAR